MPPQKKKVEGNNGVRKKKIAGKKEYVAYHIRKIKWQRLAVDPSKEPLRAAAAAAAAAAADAVPTSCWRQSNSCPDPPQGPEHTSFISPT
jgi:hypothetical protein